MQDTKIIKEENSIIDLNIYTAYNVSNDELSFFRQYLEAIEETMKMKTAKSRNNDIIELIKVSIAQSKTKVLLGEYERNI